MVKVGYFTIELVRADDTKEAFKEHTGPAPDNHVYAEVEPDMDYFICVGSSIGGVGVGLTVDGVHLGYTQHWKSPDPRKYAGSLEIKNGVHKHTAFRFNAARVKREGEMPSMMTGKVKAAFHESGEKCYKEAKDFVSKQLTGDSKLGGKKCVVSTNGTSVLDKKRKKGKNNQIRHYKKGQHLCTITLNYCTAVGLIVNKILDAPPPDPINNEPGVVKSENTKKRIKSENTKKRSRAETTVPAVSSTEEKKARESSLNSSEVATVRKTCQLVDLTSPNSSEVVDLTGNDERWI